MARRGRGVGALGWAVAGSERLRAEWRTVMSWQRPRVAQMAPGEGWRRLACSARGRARRASAGSALSTATSRSLSSSGIMLRPSTSTSTSSKALVPMMPTYSAASPSATTKRCGAPGGDARTE